MRQKENAEIAVTVKQVEAIGMQSVTDGKFRRDYFHLNFLEKLDGVTVTGDIAANPNAKVADER